MGKEVVVFLGERADLGSHMEQQQCTVCSALCLPSGRHVSCVILGLPLGAYQATLVYPILRQEGKRVVKKHLGQYKDREITHQLQSQAKQNWLGEK